MKYILYLLIVVTFVAWGDSNKKQVFVWADDESCWPAIYQALKEIKEDGVYRRILQKYIGMMPPTL